MERNIRLLLAYDGTDFHGWQRQPGLRTVQDLVEQAIRRVVRHQVSLNGSGRTDAGVHAAGQVANFPTTCALPLGNLQKAIGSRLAKDISILQVREVPLAFRSSLHASSKLYRYRVWNVPARPVGRNLQRYTYHFWNPLEVDRMQDAADHLIGEHDFAAFATRGSERESTVRTILRLEVYRHYQEVRIDVEGTGFLYNQVRNIAGTLLEVGRGHWVPDRVRDILASLDRSNAGPTAPARGLCLQWVRYDLNRIPDRPSPSTAGEDTERVESRGARASDPTA
jgi:tRNA pseudouridine38-40 synthase